MALTPKQISALTAKSSVANDDLLVIGDTSDSGNAKKVLGSTLKSYISQVAFTYNVTILAGASNWTYNSTANWYTQSITCTGILASDIPHVDLNVSAAETSEDVADLLEEWADIFRIAVTNNTLTVYSTTVPTINVPITIGAVTSVAAASGQSF